MESHRHRRQSIGAEREICVHSHSHLDNSKNILFLPGSSCLFFSIDRDTLDAFTYDKMP